MMACGRQRQAQGLQPGRKRGFAGDEKLDAARQPVAEPDEEVLGQQGELVEAVAERGGCDN